MRLSIARPPASFKFSIKIVRNIRNKLLGKAEDLISRALALVELWRLADQHETPSDSDAHY